MANFGCFTVELYAMADWLKRCGIETVAMEATGVYWIAVFQILETQGFEVKLVNARQVKTVPGRKSDVLDCQWLRQLHSYGLLAGSFRPGACHLLRRKIVRCTKNIQNQYVYLSTNNGLIFSQEGDTLPFRPDDQICVLRSYIRQRDTLIKSASTLDQRMQKALTQMNVQLHRVISDISGTTGLANCLSWS